MSTPDTMTRHRIALSGLRSARWPGFLRARELPILIVFLILCFYFWWKKPDVFLRPANLAVIMRFVATYGLLAIGELLVIITGGIDLSVGSMTALTGVLVATLMMKGIDAISPINRVVHSSPPIAILPAIILVLAFAALVGLWHGFFVTKMHIPPFIITLGTWLMASGYAAYITRGYPIVFPSGFDFLTLGQGKQTIQGNEIPDVFIILVAAAALVAFILNVITLGRHIYAVRGNAEAAHVSGINVDRVRTFFYASSGMVGGLGGILLASRFGQTMRGYEIPNKFLGQTILVYEIPNKLLVLAAAALLITFILNVVLWFILNITALRRRLYAVGNHTQAARMSGITVDRVRLFWYASGGIVGGLVGILLASQLGQKLLGYEIPNMFIILIAVAVGVALILNTTTLGRHIYAVGGNIEAARVSGVNVNRVRLFCYAGSGMMGGLVGILLASRLGQGTPAVGSSYELWAIAATVIGGTSLFGGEGTVLGVILGAAIMGVMANGMVLLNVSSYLQQVVLGIVLVIAVTLDMLRRQGRLIPALRSLLDLLNRPFGG